MATIEQSARPGDLWPCDLKMFERIGVDERMLTRARVFRVTNDEARELLAQSYRQGDLAGVVFPFIHPESGRAVTHRLRRDHPEMDGDKPRNKYLNASGDAPHLYFPPGAGELLKVITAPVVLVEAQKSALALAAAAHRESWPLLPVALGGCWGWRTSRAGRTVDPDGQRVPEAGPQPDLDLVAWRGRVAVILFDANATTNPKVRVARRRFAEELVRRGALVRLGSVPQVPGVNGPDDYRIGREDKDLLRLVHDAVPLQPQSAEDVLEDCGISSLAEGAALATVEEALRALGRILQSADPIRRKLTRSAAIERLTALKMRGAATVVDAAIGKPAEASDGRSSLVRDDEPCPHSVDGSEELDGILRLLARHLVLPLHAADAIALWIAHAYAMSAWAVSPILCLVSPTKRCGKTTALCLLGALTPRSLNMANVTPAVLFRLIDTHAPTLLLDEADTWLLDEASELRGIVNSGHSKATAAVGRCVGDDHDVRIFSTWAPKVIAMIGRPPGTIEDRSVLIPLRRKSPREEVSRLRLDRFDAEMTPIRQRLRRWADDHLNALRDADPTLPASLNDRAQDNWRPLIAIADMVGGEWPERAREAAIALSSADVAEDVGTELLGDIRRIFEDASDPEALPSATIIESLVAMEHRPWAEFSNNRPITGAKLARLLKSFGVAPAGAARLGSRVARVYRRHAFVDAWSRYLSPESLQRNKPNESRTGGGESWPGEQPPCSTLPISALPERGDGCNAVTLPARGLEGNEENRDGVF